MRTIAVNKYLTCNLFFPSAVIYIECTQDIGINSIKLNNQKTINSIKINNQGEHYILIHYVPESGMSVVSEMYSILYGLCFQWQPQGISSIKKQITHIVQVGFCIIPLHSL